MQVISGWDFSILICLLVFSVMYISIIFSEFPLSMILQFGLDREQCLFCSKIRKRQSHKQQIVWAPARSKRETALVSYSISETQWPFDSSHHQHSFSKIMLTDINVKFLTKINWSNQSAEYLCDEQLPVSKILTRIGKNIQISHLIFVVFALVFF